MGYMIGKGTLLKAKVPPASSFTTITQRVSFSAPSWEMRTAETTHLDSTMAEFVSTIADGGSLPFEVEYDPTDASHVILTGLMSSGTLTHWQVVFPNVAPNQFAFDGILTKFEVGPFTVGDVIKASCEIKVSGAIVVT